MSAIGWIVYYTCPVGCTAVAMSWFINRASGSYGAIVPNYVAFGSGYGQVFSAVTFNLLSTTFVAMGPGDLFGLYQTTVGSAAVYDAYLSILQYSGGGTSGSTSIVWLGFGMTPTASTGIPIVAGATPLVLSYDLYGDMLCRDIVGVASAANTPLTILSGYT